MLRAMEAIQGHPLEACETLHATVQQFVSQAIELSGQNSKYRKRGVFGVCECVSEVCACVCLRCEFCGT